MAIYGNYLRLGKKDQTFSGRYHKGNFFLESQSYMCR
jgi:hypothetical protein